MTAALMSTRQVLTLLQLVALISSNTVVTDALSSSSSSLSVNSRLGKGNVKIGRVPAGPITISSMGFGTWSWGNKLLWNYSTDQDEELYGAYRTVRLAGASVFDTADSYGTLDLNGRAEILLGEFERRLQKDLTTAEEQSSDDADKDFLPSFLKSFMGGGEPKGVVVPDQQVATKFAPYPWRITRGSMVSAAQESLNRLQQSKLAIAQLHWSTANYQPFQEGALWEGIADVYDEGLCAAVGVSNYGPVQLSKFSDRMTERGVPLATAQIQYSLMTYADASTRDMNEACEDAGCRLIAYSPLCLGLLTGKYNEDNLPPAGNPRRQLFRELLPGAKELLGTLGSVAEERGVSTSQVAIRWAAEKGGVPIPGVRSVSMAEENLAALGDWKLGKDAVEELDRVAIRVKKPMIQNVFQTK